VQDRPKGAMTKAVGIGAVVLVLAVGAMWMLMDEKGRNGTASVKSSAEPAQGRQDFVMPALNDLERRGARLFAANCARCHGENGLGSDKGPPLVHDIYNPGHHPDEAFYRAVQFGVRQHHWKFGDMPPLRGQVRVHEVRAIIAYLRKLQQANGIVARPHRMRR